MKRNRKTKKMAAFLTALLLTALCLCQAVFAADTAGIDPTRQASLQIDLKEVGVTTTDKTATIVVYKAGEWDGTRGQYKLISAFAGSSADITKLDTADAVAKASKTLDAYALAQNLTEAGKQTTSNGEASFSGLSTGLYLVCQRKGESDNVTVSPFLTTLPVLDEETDSWNYTVKCYPKSQADTPSNPTETPTSPDDESQTGGSGEGDPGGGNAPGGSGNTGGSSGGSGGRTQTDLTRTTTMIGDDPAPQAGLTGGDGENPIEIEEEGIPLFALPKTGDDSATYGMLAGVMVLAAAGGVLMFRKRKEAMKG